MNSRERYHATTNYGNRDRLYHWEFGPYPETVKRWQKEGLPEDANWYEFGGYDRYEHAPVHVGLTHAIARPQAEALLSQLQTRLNCRDTFMADLSLSLAVHFGPGTIGFATYPAD